MRVSFSGLPTARSLPFLWLVVFFPFRFLPFVLTSSAGARVPQRGVWGVLLGGRKRGGVREHPLPEAHAGRSQPHEGLLPDTSALR